VRSPQSAASPPLTVAVKKREIALIQLNLKKQIQGDIKRYGSTLKQYKSGKAKGGEVGSRGRLFDRNDHTARHLENVIRELRALLRDG
jgi:hypothetical protein